MLSKEGFPAPNPRVACLIVKDGKFVGKGWHSFAGGPHAEIEALTQAGENARGATVYVSLEPCNHQGRTGPCSEALIKAGVKEVFYATSDPNPVAAGGAERLREAGILATLLPKSELLCESNRQFLYSHHVGRPFVTVKAGISLDGRIALPSGESQWITSEWSRRDAQKLRAERGTVLVGRTTAEVDRAKLTVRNIDVHKQPTRVVIDPHRKLSNDLPIFNDQAETIRFTHQPADERDEKFTDLPALLEALAKRGHRGVLVEGGRTTITEFLRAGLVDEIVLYVAPIILGEGPTWVSELGVQTLTEAPSFVLAGSGVLGENTIHANQKITLFSRNLSKFLTSE